MLRGERDPTATRTSCIGPMIGWVSMSVRVEDVYANRSVLLTGATGFLGKVLVEKLLWAIPNIGKIFLLIRPAKGLSPKERLEKILQDPLFTRIRNEKPQVLHKLVPIPGDLMEDSLGLNQHDMQNICDEGKQHQEILCVVKPYLQLDKFFESSRLSVSGKMKTQRLTNLKERLEPVVAAKGGHLQL
uniref:Fatty acyl-CoA reductase n=1 Tax=Heterorhabditis bacteriophora TaxID=37862 RepID=A0A1I7XCB3_HETBA